MSSLTESFYTFIYGALLLICIIGLWFASVMPDIEHWSKRFFRYYYIVLIASCFFGIMEGVLQYYHAPGLAIWGVLLLESILPSFIMLMLTVYLLHCCGESIRRSRLFRIVLALWVIYLVVLAIASFTDAFTYFSPDGYYYRGTWYPLLILPLIVIMLINLAALIHHRKRLSNKIFIGLIIAILPMTIALMVLAFADAFLFLDSCIVLSALSMYSMILSDQIEKDLLRQEEIARQQTELANQRANIMILQMRPHFIYNTMTSIYCLCNQDPELARQVIMDFTTYLRKNFTAIASPELIPFSSELEHTRAYLAVEKVQYKDSLFVDYDTPHTYFRMPPLTLQPVVENAVKHGRDPYAGSFHIVIRTRKTDLGSEIVVLDNGCGFAPSDDSEPHIALNNIKQRLELMCGGSLDITSGDEGGTVVTITIPDNTAE